MQMIMESLRILFDQIPFLIGYVTKSSAFPKPLSETEEKACLDQAARGERHALDQLIEHNLRLVAHVARKYRRCGQDMDDLISIGTIGLIKAVNSYDAAKGKTLASYAARCIENEILMVLRSGKKRKNDISLSDPIGTDHEGNTLTLLDVLGTPADELMETVENQIQIEEIRNILQNHLEPREAAVIIARYGLDGRTPMTQHEAAVLLGISRSYVSRIEKRALEKLRAEIEEK